MLLDCQTMTGIIHNCPNLSECLERSPLKRVYAHMIYCLQKNTKLEDMQADNQLLQVSQNLKQLFSINGGTFVYNQDYQTRDIIIFDTNIHWPKISGGVYGFDKLSIEKLQQLVDLGFASPIEIHNYSPAIIELLTFARIQQRKGFTFTFMGYVVSPFREDYRVSIDGIVFDGTCSEELIQDFEDFVGYSPDDLYLKPNYLLAWWD